MVLFLPSLRWRLDKLLEEKFRGNYKINTPQRGLSSLPDIYRVIHMQIHVFIHMNVTGASFSAFSFSICLCVHPRQDAGLLSPWLLEPIPVLQALPVHGDVQNPTSTPSVPPIVKHGLTHVPFLAFSVLM